MKRRESASERCQFCVVHSSTFIGLVYQEGAQELLFGTLNILDILPPLAVSGTNHPSIRDLCPSPEASRIALTS